MKVKNLIMLLASASMMFAGSVFAYGSPGITGTYHDLSIDNSDSGHMTSTTQKICKFCHTPHNATAAVNPLWNRTVPSTTYTMYSSDTIDMTIQSQPDDYSLACLSCHDGTIAIDQLVNPPYKYVSDGTLLITGEYNLGSDLSDDHPISVVYDSSADTAFNPKGSGEVGGLPLYTGTVADQVECSSCHDVHNFYPYAPFLRADNTNSAMCLTCHIK